MINSYGKKGLRVECGNIYNDHEIVITILKLFFSFEYCHDMSN